MTVDLKEWQPLISQVARVGRRYGIEHEDVQQELYAWWYESQRYVEEYTDPNHEGGVGKLKTALYNHARKFCLVERANRSGFDPEDNYFYATDTIDSLMSLVFDPEGVSLLGVVGDGQPKAKKDAAEGGDLMAMVVDVRCAIEKLDAGDQGFLSSAWECGFRWGEVAERYGVEERSAEQRYRRLVARVQRLLAGPRPSGWSGFVGARKAMSNAASQAVTSDGWDDA